MPPEPQPPLPPCRLTHCVALEVSGGTLVVGLFGHDCPATVENFLGLCAVGFYHGTYVRRVVRNNFIEIRPHDEVGCWTYEGLLAQDPNRTVPLELTNQQSGVSAPANSKNTVRVLRRLRINREGLLLAFPDGDGKTTTCCFGITLPTTKPLDYLERKVTVFGAVLEGFPLLRRLNAAALIDQKSGASGAGVTDGRPVRLCRLQRTTILDGSKPPGVFNMTAFVRGIRQRLEADGQQLPPCAIELDDGDDSADDGRPRYDPDQAFGLLHSDDEDEAAGTATSGRRQQQPLTPEEAAAAERLRMASMAAQRARIDRSRTLMLQLLGELPEDASGFKPPENVLFVCKLNPYTSAADLGMIFSQFGKVLSSEIIKDPKTGHSLQYAFVEFATVDACQRAYFKMENVLVDDSRIHVDFCQSVAGVWRKQQQAKHQIPKEVPVPPRGPHGTLAPGKRSRDEG
jgi:peptidyl-prolyl cis-trans isomerase-like 4